MSLSSATDQFSRQKTKSIHSPIKWKIYSKSCYMDLSAFLTFCLFLLCLDLARWFVRPKVAINCAGELLISLLNQSQPTQGTLSLQRTRKYVERVFLNGCLWCPGRHATNAKSKKNAFIPCPQFKYLFYLVRSQNAKNWNYGA